MWKHNIAFWQLHISHSMVHAIRQCIFKCIFTLQHYNNYQLWPTPRIETPPLETHPVFIKFNAWQMHPHTICVRSN